MIGIIPGAIHRSCFSSRRLHAGVSLVLAVLTSCPALNASTHAEDDGRPADRPNIILCMTDDQGWGDTGYNGHPILKTPTLDEMSRSGIRFTRFYAAAPVCSPTRGSCLTGRHPFRYGIFHANVGHLPRQEINLAELLKRSGYTTGHFGKWHLGTLTKTVKDSNRGGPRGAKHYAPPWERGFDVCFSTEAKVPTCDPMITPVDWKKGKAGEAFGTYYWIGPGRRVTDNLDGDDSRIIMDRAIPFIESAAKAGKPFFAVVWFHTPHLPVVAETKHRAIYKDQPDRAQHHFGCLSAMDEQMGRLRQTLARLGVRENTMLWFCSDNGPEGRRYNGTNGSAGPLRGRKRSLYEGGVRVPGLLEWPARAREPRAVSMPCSTSDYLPTILDLLGVNLPDPDRPIDGISLLDTIDGKRTERPKPIGFQSKGQVALIDNRYKLYRAGQGKPYELYDLIEDPSESKDLAAAKPDLVARMKRQIEAWRASCKASLAGQDYAAGQP